MTKNTLSFVLSDYVHEIKETNQDWKSQKQDKKFLIYLTLRKKATEQFVKIFQALSFTLTRGVQVFLWATQ